MQGGNKAIHYAWQITKEWRQHLALYNTRNKADNVNAKENKIMNVNSLYSEKREKQDWKWLSTNKRFTCFTLPYDEEEK